MRDGVPLPGITAGEVVSQLTYRVFGPLRGSKVRSVLDFHGLAGRPAGSVSEIAVRQDISAPTVSNRVRKVREAGVRLPLDPAVIHDASRPSRPGEDHRGRVRIATTLGISAPEPTATVRPPRLPSSSPLVGHAALRLIAALGPLDTDSLLAASNRARRFRKRPAPSTAAFKDALLAVGATLDSDGLWHPPPTAVAPERYLTILAAVAGRELSRRQVKEVLLAAGYRNGSLTPLASSHPLFQELGPDRYRVIQAAKGSTKTPCPRDGSTGDDLG